MLYTYYGGDALPLWQNFVGAGVLASIFGNPYTFTDDTVWVDQQPFLQDIDHRQPLIFDTAGPMWDLVTRTTESFSKNAGHEYFSGITDIGGGLDTACAIRGTQQLLIDMFECPEAVERLMEEIDWGWFKCYDALDRLIRENTEIVIGSWMPIWCPHRWYALQSDTSAMISPKMYERFVLPSIIRQAKYLDRTLYHLDGPQAIRHLDMVLDVKEITGVEWVAGPYETVDRGGEQWYPMFEKIQKAGKNLIIRYAWPQSVPKLLENISHRGLFVSAECRNEEDGRALLNIMEKMKVRA
jgi:hypothetical protein